MPFLITTFSLYSRFNAPVPITNSERYSVALCLSRGMMFNDITEINKKIEKINKITNDLR